MIGEKPSPGKELSIKKPYNKPSPEKGLKKSYSTFKVKKYQQLQLKSKAANLSTSEQ